ncbi:hypothetical protein B7486_34230 [cyanobacterium TDX16]|nr:hypothetical protein B7486_34230 [cyanobacterium TDX16]
MREQLIAIARTLARKANNQIKGTLVQSRDCHQKPVSCGPYRGPLSGEERSRNAGESIGIPVCRDHEAGDKVSPVCASFVMALTVCKLRQSTTQFFKKWKTWWITRMLQVTRKAKCTIDIGCKELG